MKKLSFILLVSFLFIPTLSGAITATYTPANSIYLQKGDEVVVLPNTPAGTFPANKYVIYLGTIKITTDSNDVYYSPHLENYFNANKIYLFDSNGNRHSELEVYVNNTIQGQPNRIYLSNKESPLCNPSNYPIEVNPFIVDLFLVSSMSVSGFNENQTYTIPAGTIGSFNVYVFRNGSYVGKEYIPVNDQVVDPNKKPDDSTSPIPEAGSGGAVPDIPVGEEPEPLMFQVNILEHSPFNLSQAFTSTGVKVATSVITVINGDQGGNYNLKVKFTNPQNSSTFSLRPVNRPNGYAIPYRLRFGSQNDVKGGTLYDWNGLSYPGTNSRDINVYDVDEFVVGNAPAGVFEDTILVEIFNAH